jgi:hypothetical protein
MFNEQHEPPFEVYGDSEILKEMIINIWSIYGDPRSRAYVEKIQTLLYKGRQYALKNDLAFRYKIFCAYKNKVIKMEFDNLRPGKATPINHLYISNEHDGIYIMYSGYNGNYPPPPKYGPGIEFEDYLQKYNIVNKDEQEVLRKQFFEFYDPALQEARRLPLGEDKLEYYRKLSLEDKKAYNMPVEYILQMNLPEDELKELLEHAKKRLK